MSTAKHIKKTIKELSWSSNVREMFWSADGQVLVMYWQGTKIGCWSCRGFVNSYFLLTRHKLQRTFIKMICCQKLIVFLFNFQARIFWRNFPYFTTSPSLHDEFWMMLQLLQPAPIFSRSCLSKSSLLWSSRTQYS